MPIIKKSVFDKTTILTNEFLQNENISLEAKGLLGYMLSLPNNWDFTIAGISAKTNTSEYKITKLLQELETNGYHTKKHLYKNGRIKDWIYYIFAEPRQDIIDKTFDITTFEQELENQDVEKQECCFSSDKQTISNKLDIEKEQKQKEYIVEETDNSNLTEPKIDEKTFLKENTKCIIDYLNEVANTKYKYNAKETTKLIKARFKDGYVLDDFYDVIDNKWKDWRNTEWEKYMRPTTLFSNKHFEEYLNQKTVFKGKPKTTYSSIPTFDNTASHNNIENFKSEDLAKDNNGNLIKF